MIERTFLRAETDAVTAPASAGADQSYVEFAPSPALRPWVERIDLCSERLPPGTTIEERVLPDGAARLLFSLTAPPAVVGAAPAAAAAAIGASAAAEVIRMRGTVEGVGVTLRPGALPALLGEAAGALAGRSVPLDALWGDAAGELLERLAAVPHGPARAAVVERALAARLTRRAPPPHEGAARAVEVIARRRGALRVRDLAAEVGVGERRLEQLFHEHVGLSPKTACRLARFRAALALLRREPASSWSGIAHACGYADHPHLVRDFREIAGLTPGALRRSLGFGFHQDAGAGAR